MNPFPNQWKAALWEHEKVPVVLLDGAIRVKLGARLATDSMSALSFFPDESAQVQAVGPWLISEDRALALGIDGCERGVNWLLSTLTFEQTYEHLMTWMRGPDPDAREWSRLADARALLAFSKVWTAPQWEAFCLPWLEWCYANRSGVGQLLTLPQKPAVPIVSNPYNRPAPPAPVLPIPLTAEQEKALTLATLVDQVVHALRATIVWSKGLKGGREYLHSILQNNLNYAVSQGYECERDLTAIISWAMRKPLSARGIREIQAIEMKLTGEELTRALEQEIENALYKESRNR